jgi:acyl-CoA dehydrogenase
MTYRAPVEDLLFAMTHAAGLQQGLDDGIYTDLADGMAGTLLSEAARFAEDVLAPINRAGDEHGATLKDGAVTTAPGWKEAYAHWREGGWQGLVAAPDHGGMGLPHLVETACFEMWSAANMAFMLGPLLSFGAADAIATHGAPELKEHWLGKIVSGEWTATMNLTEPQAGSDLNALRAKAERNDDGTYRIFGQKIFITYGEHDLADNIVHLVLARLPDAPAGTRGISLFLVPKFLLDDSGMPAKRNDVRCAGLEHKMGIHGSPTCTMVYGDEGGAVGWLVGEENRGLACMFTMMNAARLAVGVQGVALGDRAFQQALGYARDRRQGKAPGDASAGMSPIALHPDVQRMLMTMRAKTEAARLICLMTANALDVSKRAADEGKRKQAAERAGLLTPVAKAYSTDIGNEVASLGVQVHGGMGFIEETGAAQHMRDVRIAAIYEGTNGIQAIDLMTRKLGLSSGDAVRREIASMRATLERLRATNAPAFGAMAERLGDCLASFERATQWCVTALSANMPDALAAATPYLRLFGLARGGTGLAEVALAAHQAAPDGSDRRQAGRIAIARFFAENIAVESSALERSVVDGSASVHLAATALELA